MIQRDLIACATHTERDTRSIAIQPLLTAQAAVQRRGSDQGLGWPARSTGRSRAVPYYGATEPLDILTRDELAENPKDLVTT